MTLYKFTTSAEIARLISIGVFRFYELVKYVKMEEDNLGRSDANECSVTFPEDEYIKYPEKLPTASFGGINFKCISISLPEEHIKQYFVFCMSTGASSDVIGDSTHVVELSEDMFQTFEMIFTKQKVEPQADVGYKFFSHGPVEYYNIDRHPVPYGPEKWREIYVKHSKFAHQQEYRAAIFASDLFFEKLKSGPTTLTRKIYRDGKQMNFDLNLVISSGTDANGWRYLELDISEFSANICSEPCKVMETRSAL